MDISTNLVFFPDKVQADIYSKVLLQGSGALDKSRKLDNYQTSLREIFGLCVLTNFREYLQPEGRWAFTTDNNISDDGAVVNLDKDNRSTYIENIEQIYLPGKYLKRDSTESVNDYVLRHVEDKRSKGAEYSKDKSLLILLDVDPNDSEDYFYWQEFVKDFFKSRTFLHVYLLSLTDHLINRYHLLSFTDQKHRQYLNGQFEFTLTPNGMVDFKCIQKIDLLNPPTSK